MKHASFMIATMIALLAASALRAQPPMEDSDVPIDAPPPRAAGEPRGPFRMGPPGHQPHSPLQRALMELKSQQPDEFERLQALRQRDPAAFRAEARELVEQAFMRKMQKDRPAVYEALNGLNEQDRAWMFERLAAGAARFGAGPRPEGERMDRQPPGPETPEDRDGFVEARQLIRKYRKAETAEDRANIRAQLRDLLAKDYDRHLAQRREQLAEMEGRIEQARTALQAGEQDKDAFIDERLSALLEKGPPPDRRGPFGPPPAD